MELPEYINSAGGTLAVKGCSACAICAACAACLGDGPIPDFEGAGILGLAGLMGLIDATHAVCGTPDPL